MAEAGDAIMGSANRQSAGTTCLRQPGQVRPPLNFFSPNAIYEIKLQCRHISLYPNPFFLSP